MNHNASEMIYFEQDGRRFHASGPDANLTWSATKDVLLNRSYEYLPTFELQNHRGLVVDAGAHVGLFSIIAANFANTVVSIEPDPTNAKFLRQNLEENGIRNVVVDPRLLWNVKAQVKLFTTGNSVNASALKPGPRFLNVDTVTLREIINGHGPIDLLKLDVEGAEFPIIEELSPEDFNNIDALVVELHFLFGSVEPVVSKLRSAGFKTEWFFQPVYRSSLPHRITVIGARRLKIWRSLVYTAARLMNLKERHLGLLFAYRDAPR